MYTTYKTIHCNIPDSTAVVMDFENQGWEFMTVVQANPYEYVYWFKKKIYHTSEDNKPYDRARLS